MRVTPKLMAATALLTLAACTNAAPSGLADDQSASRDRAAVTDRGSVSAVSDALGQRLDGMLSARQSAGSASR